MQATPGGLGDVSGVLAFAQGNGNPVPPPNLGPRDIASIIPYEQYGDARLETTSEKYYTVDPGTFELTQIHGGNPQDGQSTFALDTAVIAESNVDPILMLRWGRWSGGNVAELDLGSGLTIPMDLTQRSLHWVEGADSATPPVLPTSGTVAFVLAGATSPTDRVGNIGTLNSASLTADFTAQQVTTALNISMNGDTWIATGQGPIGAQANLADHQFSGVINGGSISSLSGVPAPIGNFSGFFTNPGGAPGSVPAGAGMSYTMHDPQGIYLNNGAFSIDGVAVFKKP
jgi:hypothetical protein